MLQSTNEQHRIQNLDFNQVAILKYVDLPAYLNARIAISKKSQQFVP